MPKRKYRPKPKEHKRIARERIEKLFTQAEIMFHESPKLADKYINLARKMAMKYKVRIRPELKRRFCKHCYKYLKQGVNCRVRLQGQKVVYYCMSCKNYMRFPYKKDR